MNDDSIFPEIGQHVKCLLINNTLAEGYVMLWLHDKVKLKSLDGESVFIIHHPDRDIVMTKVVLDPPAEIEKDPVVSVPLEGATDLEKQWEETYAGPSDNELRTKKLAELKILMAKQDRKIVSEKIRSHHGGSAYAPRLPLYQTPDMAKVGLPRSPYQPGKLPRK